MPKALTKYNVSWESEFSFLKPGPTEHEAHCLDCNHNFPISNGGKNYIKKHIQCKMHKKDIIENSSNLVECAENQVDENNDVGWKVVTFKIKTYIYTEYKTNKAIIFIYVFELSIFL